MHKLTYKSVYLCVLLIAMVSMRAETQEQTEESAPTANDETYCYAAGSQWICAGESEREQAEQRAQAIRLAEENKRKNDRALQRQDPQVEITTLAPIPAFDSVANQPKEAGLSDQSAPSGATLSVADNKPNASVADDIVKEPPLLKDEGESLAANEDESASSTMAGMTDEFRRWLQEYPDDWSIQVIGISNIQNLNQFYLNHGLQAADFVVVETRSQGAPWWVVLYKHFPNRDAAVAGKDELPAALADQAWVRPIASLQ